MISRQLKSIAVSPDPPVPGKNLTVSVEADVLETITVNFSPPRSINPLWRQLS